MAESPESRLSRFLSLVLRHKPETIGIQLNQAGWTNVTALLKALNNHARPCTLELLAKIVAEDEKGRYEYSENKQMIRAAQGHSLKVNLGYKPEQPPHELYHGTPYRFITSIKQMGLTKQKRHAVHLSPNKETAAIVGARRGSAIILAVNTKQMFQDGYVFYQSSNGVWLTDQVPAKYINFHNSEPAGNQRS